MSNQVNTIDKFINEYRKFHTVVLLDELCSLSIDSFRKFSFETSYRIDAIRKLILQRTKESSAAEGDVNKCLSSPEGDVY